MVDFAFVIPTRNSATTLKRALASLAYQSYGGWRAIVVDDCSTDSTAETLLQAAKEMGVHDKVTLVRNDERKWEIANTLIALKRVMSEEVVCRLDLDDYLCDLNALEIIAKQYERDDELDAIWTMHRWWDSSGITTQNISGPMSQGVDVYKHPWCASHLKTFRKRVIEGISEENFKGADGQYFKRIGDQAFMLPALHNSKKYKFLPFAAYAYYCPMNASNFQSEDALFQKQEAEFLRSRGFVK